MKFDVHDLNPVAIALDRIEVEGDIRFFGFDLDSGARVVVTIEREETSAPLRGDAVDTSGLVLMLTLGTPSEAA